MILLNSLNSKFEKKIKSENFNHEIDEYNQKSNNNINNIEIKEKGKDLNSNDDDDDDDIIDIKVRKGKKRKLKSIIVSDEEDNYSLDERSTILEKFIEDEKQERRNSGIFNRQKIYLMEEEEEELKKEDNNSHISTFVNNKINNKAPENEIIVKTIKKKSK